MVNFTSNIYQMKREILSFFNKIFRNLSKSERTNLPKNESSQQNCAAAEACLSHVKVQITASRKDIYLVLVYGITEHPMMLATSKYKVSVGQLSRLRANSNLSSRTLNTLREILDCKPEDVAIFIKKLWRFKDALSDCKLYIPML